MNHRFLWVSLELAAVAAGACSSFVETHIWSPAYSYFMLMLLVVLDLAATWWLNERRYRRRWLLMLPAYTVVMAFAHAFGKNEQGLFWLPQAVIGLLVVVHLRRLIISFGKLQLVEDEVATVLNTRLKRRLQEELEATGAEVVPTLEVKPDEAVPA